MTNRPHVHGAIFPPTSQRIDFFKFQIFQEENYRLRNEKSHWAGKGMPATEIPKRQELKNLASVLKMLILTDESERTKTETCTLKIS
ncbi:MAG: hypothetical protein AAB962_00580 [Patescibacteria group bacterium]